MTSLLTFHKFHTNYTVFNVNVENAVSEFSSWKILLLILFELGVFSVTEKPERRKGAKSNPYSSILLIV